MNLTSTTATTTARTADQEGKRLWWAFVLARYTRGRREQLGLTVSAAAELAGLQISEWLGLEDGWVPPELGTLQAIAGTLRVDWMDYHNLAFLAECHQQCR